MLAQETTLENLKKSQYSTTKMSQQHRYLVGGRGVACWIIIIVWVKLI